MKRLLIAILVSACTYVSAQKPVFNTYFDTSYFFMEVADTTVIEEPIFHLDTMAGNRYGKYSHVALKYAQEVFGTKVRGGLCGELGERFCDLTHTDMVFKYKAVRGDRSQMEVGDIIVFPQFMNYGGKGWTYDNSPGAEHLAMFMGMKDDSTMLIMDQNSSGGPTFYTKAVVREIYLPEMHYFNGNNKHVPYFSVYKYQPRKVLKKEYSFLGKQ